MDKKLFSSVRENSRQTVGKIWFPVDNILHVDGLMQDCSNFIANTLELLQSSTKPSMCS